MFWGKTFFFWKIDFLNSVLGHFKPRPIFSAGLSNSFLPVYRKFLGEVFFSEKIRVLNNFRHWAKDFRQLPKYYQQDCQNSNLPMNFFQKKKVLWKMHIIFSSLFFGHCLKKLRSFYVSSGKVWGRNLSFLKNISFFIIRSFSLQGRNFFIESIKCALYVSMGAFWEKIIILFGRKHPHLSLSDIVRKISGVVSDFFRQGCRNCFLRVYENNMKKNVF